ncbi:MAG: AbrB/MazE/SpoVT family DNA-binding domain-containing protein [Chloroflexi bacterium]|nr:AbrB/MazE/SpoVT family DNA-binding domain-containing protein [Chloroflexota bacterium]MBU1660967.1 AbrB/MazE/SpoVT family DNA-binding domain-containing protein [Chloroflexota bacterium]
MISTLQIRSKGTITLPANLRRKYNWSKGKELNMIDLGNGLILLKPYGSQVDKLADQIRTELEAKGETLESMLMSLREVREEYASQQPTP